MKVRKILTEADAHTIQEIKRKFTEDPDENSKLQTLKWFLINDCGLDSRVWPNLERLGNSLLFDWIESFKFEEAGRNGNEFIAALNKPNSEVFITLTEDRFAKAYNSYASGYIDKDKLEDSPLYNPLLYKNDEKGVKQILSYWDQLYDKYNQELNHDEFTSVFYEDRDNKELRTLADITQRVNSLKTQNKKVNKKANKKVKSINDSDKEMLKSLLDKSDDLKNYARELLNSENNNLQ